MRRDRRRARFGSARGATLGALLLGASASLVAADEKPPKSAEARIEGAWAALRGEFDPNAEGDGSPTDLRGSETPDLATSPGAEGATAPSSIGGATAPASIGGTTAPASTGGATAPAPTGGGVVPSSTGGGAALPSTEGEEGAAAVAPGIPAIGYAPDAGGAGFPTDRVFAVGPRPIVVPVPRRRPSVPTVATQVAALDAAAGVGASPRLAEAPPILAEDGVFGPPKKVPKEALPYLHLIKREAAKNKVPLWLAVGVGFVESKYDPKLRGSHSVVGIMQVMPSTARFQGYKGTNEQLLDPETNIVWGMRELGWTWAAAKGDPCLAVAKYKGGIATKSISAAAWNYCHTAKKVTGML